ncbi:MAG: site-2 protease family protein [Chloroflexi bacterium]|nr:site-2 protease family protein [Chloroflexota bacterium]
MNNSWRIGRLMGIDVAIDASWFLIAFLLVYTLGFVQFPHELHPRSFLARADGMSITLGVVTCLLLFASVLAHEFSHSWMAIHRGIPVQRITLFIFGGVAQISEEPDRPSTEFLIAIMGPLMSLALAAVFGSAWIWLQVLESARILDTALVPLILLTSVLTQVNAQLALFNLAPGFPLDGGRVFRAILWAITHNVQRATWWAARTGQAIAVALVLIGAWLFFSQSNLAGIWLALIGLFLWNAATDGYRQTALVESLRGVNVGQLMTRPFETVPSEMSLASFVDGYLLTRREQTFAVTDGVRPLGIVSLDEVKRIPRPEWPVRRVRDAMISLADIEPLSPNQTAALALARLSRTESSELPVMDAGQLAGFIGRAEIARFIRLKQGRPV